jgi:hypothetical protein
MTVFLSRRLVSCAIKTLAFFLIALGTYTCTALAADQSNGDRRAIVVGFNLLHSQIDVSKVTECKVLGAGATLSAQNSIVNHFNDPDVRKRTMSDLEAMAQQGAKAFRSFVFFAPHPNDNAIAHLGVVNINDDTVHRQIVKNIFDLVSQAQKAGYDHMFLAFGAMGTLAPNCFHHAWGDCFDPSSINQTWAFEQPIIQAANRAAGPSFQLTFDLGNELCFNDSNDLLDQQKRIFVQRITGLYANTFHNRNFTVSCHAPHLFGFLARLSSTYSAFRHWGTLPNVITLHLGDWRSADLAKVVLEANSIAESSNANVAVDETAYSNSSTYQLLGHLSANGQASRLKSILFWPNSISSGCHISVAPPYNMRPMEYDIKSGEGWR